MLPNKAISILLVVLFLGAQKDYFVGVVTLLTLDRLDASLILIMGESLHPYLNWVLRWQGDGCRKIRITVLSRIDH